MNALYRVILIGQIETREMLKNLLEEKKNFLIICESSNGKEAIDLCDYYLPDMLIIDIDCMDGFLHDIKIIKERNPFTKVVTLTDNNRVVNFFSACSIGVQGYLLKSLYPKEWLRYIESIANGQCEEIADLYKKIFLHLKENDLELNPSLPLSLSQKEKQVILYMTKGMTNRQIAENMKVSVNTVKTHIKSIYKKTNLHSRSQLASHVMKSLFM